jgi:hypothetical protein
MQAAAVIRFACAVAAPTCVKDRSLHSVAARPGFAYRLRERRCGKLRIARGNQGLLSLRRPRMP